MSSLPSDSLWQRARKIERFHVRATSYKSARAIYRAPAQFLIQSRVHESGCVSIYVCVCVWICVNASRCH